MFKKAVMYGGARITGMMEGLNWSEGWNYVTETFDASYANHAFKDGNTVKPNSRACKFLIKY